ncbi:MAG: thioredoxin family protein [Clostridia bacterium]|nr:thioredoxin family protein [Clostridia bacterium]
MHKPILYFMLPTCPYCRRANQYLKELMEENPAFRELEIRTVDESREVDFANSYDYYYVPTFYVDGKKICEGVLEKEDVRSVLEQAI